MANNVTSAVEAYGVTTPAAATVGGFVRTEATGMQALAYADAFPSNADVNTILAGSPGSTNFAVGGASNMLMIMSLAAKSTSAASATAQDFHSEVDLQYSLTGITAQQLLVSFLGSTSTGDGTVTLAFTNTFQNVKFNQTFSTFALADAYFATEPTINLGTVQNGSLALSFDLDVMTTQANASFDPIFVGGNSTVGSGAILGDANLDGRVDLTDLNIVLNNLGTTSSLRSHGNFDGAATIDLTDLNDVLNNLGVGAPGSSGLAATSIPTPEPASLMIAALGVTALSLRRRVK